METSKVCATCKSEKDRSEFYTKERNGIELTSRCRACVKQDNIDYHRSYKGRISTIIGGHKANSKTWDFPPPSYSKAELIEWLEHSVQYSAMHTQWVASGYEIDRSPCVGRIDHTKPFTMDNLKLMDWEQGRQERDTLRRDGKIGPTRPVVATNREGEARSFPTINECIRETGVSHSRIVYALNKPNHYVGGYTIKDEIKS